MLTLPHIEEGEYLLRYLFEIGTGKPAGMGGLVAIDHTDIAAWQHNTHTRLEAWEAKTIRALSREYCAQLSASTKPDAKPPYAEYTEMTPESREEVAKKIKALFAPHVKS